MLQIRNAIPTDLPAIVSIYNATIPGRMVTADTSPVSVESRQEWFASFTPQRPLLVAEQDGEIVGWMSFRPFYGRPAYDATAEIGIYISEAQRGKGLGRLLLQHMIREAPQLGLRTLLGFIFGHNQPSLLLFEKLGFRRWGTLPEVARMDGKDYDLIIMGLKLPQENSLIKS